MDFAEWIGAQRTQFIADILSLVDIPSVSRPTGNSDAPFGRECVRVLQRMARICRDKGFEMHNHENYCGTVLFKGELADEIGIFNHLDVVPEGTGWTYEPYRGVCRDNCIIGRGTNDNKGPTVAALYALYYLKSRGWAPRHSIRLFFGVNEELGMEDIDYYLKHNPMPVFAFSPDGPSWPTCNGEKGILTLRARSSDCGSVLADFRAGISDNSVPGTAYALLSCPADADFGSAETERLDSGLIKVSVSGVAGHAAFPETTDSAAVKLARVLLSSGVLDGAGTAAMEALLAFFSDYYGEGFDIACDDPRMGRLTHVGSRMSLENGVMTVTANIRYPALASGADMRGHIERRLRHYGFTLTEYADNPPMYIDPECPELKAMTEICSRQLGRECRPYVMGGGTYARKLKKAVAFGPFSPEDTCKFGPDRGRGHQVDEYADISSLITAVSIIAETLTELDKLEL